MPGKQAGEDGEVKRSPLRRKTWLKRSPMRRRRRVDQAGDVAAQGFGSGPTKYRRRVRDLAYMGWVKTRPCSAGSWEIPLLWRGPRPDACRGAIEAHHAGVRGVGQKAPDATCIGLCSHHHRELTDRAGCFAGWPRGALKDWELAVVDRYQELYAVRGDGGPF